MNHLDRFSVWELARDGCAETFTEKLLEHQDELETIGGVSQPYFTGTPLSVAAEYGNSEIVQICLENGANANSVDSRGRTPLFHAMTTKGLGATMSLLQHKADVSIPDRNGITPLICAIKYNLPGLVMLLIDNGADVSIPDRNGNTPLIHAIKKDLPGVVMLLIQNGADPCAKHIDGETSLGFAIMKGYFGCMKILIEKGADLFAKNSDGQTVLHVAAEQGQFGCMKILLDRHCNINCRDDSGWTPLHAAIRAGREDSVRILIHYGAAPDTTDMEYALTRERAVNHPSHKACYRRPWSTIRILVEKEIKRRDDIVRREAIAMGLHDRLGKGSRLYPLDEGVVGIIRQYL